MPARPLGQDHSKVVVTSEKQHFWVPTPPLLVPGEPPAPLVRVSAVDELVLLGESGPAVGGGGRCGAAAWGPMVVTVLTHTPAIPVSAVRKDSSPPIFVEAAGRLAVPVTWRRGARNELGSPEKQKLVGFAFPEMQNLCRIQLPPPYFCAPPPRFHLVNP